MGSRAIRRSIGKEGSGGKRAVGRKQAVGEERQYGKRWRQRPHGQREKKHITGRVHIYGGRTAEQTIRSAHILPLSLFN